MIKNTTIKMVLVFKKTKKKLIYVEWYGLDRVR